MIKSVIFYWNKKNVKPIFVYLEVYVKYWTQSCSAIETILEEEYISYKYQIGQILIVLNIYKFL